MSEVGERIKEIRERMGWSQRELAKRANLSYSMISHIETGKRDGTGDSIDLLFLPSPSTPYEGAYKK